MTRRGFVLAGLAIAVVATRAAGDDGLRDYPTVGAAFRAPVGWTEVPRSRAKTVGEWRLRPDAAEGESPTIIVEAAEPMDKSLDKLGQGLARSFGGTDIPERVTLGGQPAVKVLAKNPGNAPHPVVSLATLRDGRLYLIMGIASPGQKVDDEVEALRASWKWRPIESPIAHLDPLPPPRPIFGGAASLRMPDRMFAHPTEHPERILDLGLDNLLKKRTDFYAYVQRLPVPEGRAWDELLGALSENIRRTSVADKAPAWTSRGGDSHRSATPFFMGKRPAAGGKVTVSTPIRFAAVRLDDGTMILVNFTITAEATADERAAYETLTDRMIDSIRSGTLAN